MGEPFGVSESAGLLSSALTYGYGRIPLLDVIAQQRRYIDLETGFTNVLLDAYAARVALEQAVGTSLP